MLEEKERKIVLASKSFRRKELFKQVGIEFDIRESDFEEDMTLKKKPVELAKFLALEKAKDVAKHYEDAIVIGADTFVVSGRELIGKPKDEEDAERILKKLSGKWHKIVTGFAIIDTKNNIVVNDFGEAKVKFRKLGIEEIRNYIATGEPMDKAGAYGLQNKAAVFAEKISGDFYSIVGLPLCKICEALQKMGIEILK